MLQLGRAGLWFLSRGCLCARSRQDDADVRSGAHDPAARRPEFHQAEAEYARSWYDSITSEIYG
ncbi:FCSD flavin-binding domain-containing protein [Paracoccus sp. Z118]|nr:FCSD flavin-binding domain-containing protein [Paracoccus sp. Z118]